ncbi:MAG: hypothetical protein M3405_14760 [Acidobacteriota bacterium]|nr:hypothetical protein [Acidobacteriota bacterium]
MDNEIDIAKLLDEIDEEAKHNFPVDEVKQNFKLILIAEEITEIIFLKMKGKLSAFFILERLSTLLSKLDLPFEIENVVFDDIETKLKIEQRKFSKNEIDFRRYSSLLFELKLFSVSYFKNKIYQNLMDCDLPQKLKLVKKELSNIFSPEEKYIKEAFLEIKKTLENEIELKKEEISNRQQLATLNDINNEVEIPKKHKDLTLDRAVLFMDYLFRFAETSSFNTSKAEAISFLTGFSEETLRQRLSTIYNEKNKKDNSFKKDIRVVRNLFDKLGLSEIVKKIDQDS